MPIMVVKAEHIHGRPLNMLVMKEGVAVSVENQLIFLAFIIMASENARLINGITNKYRYYL